jgi:hypothetical protein
MFGRFDMKVADVHSRVEVDKNDNPRRVTTFDLVSELDDDLAAGMGDPARDALKHLRSGAMSATALPLDAVKCVVTLDGGEADKHQLVCAGVKATLAKPKKEGSSPTVRLQLAFATRHQHATWLVDHLETALRVTIERAQQDLPLVEQEA